MDVEERRLANRSRMTRMEDAFNAKHKKQAIMLSCPFSPKNQERYVTTQGEFLSEEDCISDIDSHQPPELALSCPSLRTLFHWNKFLKVWKKLSIKRHTSPTRVPNNAPTYVAQSIGQISGFYDNPLSSFEHFSFSHLAEATNNFTDENLIGSGGFADVYKGCLGDGQLVAVKRLKRGTPDDRIASFLAELGIMVYVDHHNTAKLIGIGVQGGMHLVFKLSPLGDLGSLLHGPNCGYLDWSKRYKIILGIADGLRYLHQDCPKRIIHRDIKADNILLTENLEPQICDFGLAMYIPRECGFFNATKFEGTFGYFAPEYLMNGIVHDKTDVYSFGILLLELITGRRALDCYEQSIVLWAKPLYEADNIDALVDPCLGDNYDRVEMDRVILTASLCVEHYPILRPSMSQVVTLLRGEDMVHDG